MEKIQKRKSGVAALQLIDIVKTYGDGENAVHALKGINISFRKNEFVSVLGPSGCGKTTMLNIVGGLDRYTSGDLVINGVSTKEYTDRDWDTYRNNSIGFVFQSYNLIPHQTVLSNVELALTLSGVSKTDRHRRAKDVLKKVGLSDQAHKKPNQLSGGQMQRVAIARALVNDPEIILADEPTGALDTETSIQIMDLLQEVARDRLVIMVTHNPALAEKYSTRIINLLDGEKTGDTNPLTETEEIVSAAVAETDNSTAENSAETVKEFDEQAKDVSGAKDKKAKKEKGKAAMKLGTAFSLSFSNLRTKKGRTTLTSIAGSIGIIGIALVLAVSTGFSGYIKNLQSDTLSTYPLTVSEATIDLSDFEKLTSRTVDDEILAQKLTEKVYTKALFGDLTNMLKSNNITKTYIDYVEDYADKSNADAEKTEDKWAYCVQRGYGMDVNNFLYSDIGFLGMNFTMPIDQLVNYLERMFDKGVKNSNFNISSEFVRTYIPTISEIPDNRTLIESQYELIDDGGKWPENENELLLVTNKYNEISDITLALLGFRTIDGIDSNTYSVNFGGEESFDFDKAKEKSFYYLKNDNRYVKSSDGNWYDKTYLKGQLTSPDLELKITGIARLKEGIQQGVLDTGIAYTSKFKERILTDNKLVYTYDDNGNVVSVDGPAICVAAYSAHQNPIKVYSWYLATDDDGNVVPTASDPTMYGVYSTVPPIAQAIIKELVISQDYNLRTLAGDDTVSKLYIYSRDYESKENMKAYLDEWNDKPGRQEEDKVHYSDSTAMLFSAMNAIVDAVKIVLIAFTAISLVVSSIMIGIITYVSVVERTKEIGVLRSIGARKKDISRIFNAETFLIGLFAGIIGVGVSYLLTIPINLIIGHFISGAGAMAALKITDALFLVVISFVLTLIAGVIPARIAADKDPVVALRSE
ncbi:MAG: ABC transporter ATP-binding protein/permease [Clostridia bacterium]|nr:ABC transporter ATP-binding protein/permease [Clostridia bacterium]